MTNFSFEIKNNGLGIINIKKRIYKLVISIDRIITNINWEFVV